MRTPLTVLYLLALSSGGAHAADPVLFSGDAAAAVKLVAKRADRDRVELNAIQLSELLAELDRPMLLPIGRVESCREAAISPGHFTDAVGEAEGDILYMEYDSAVERLEALSRTMPCLSGGVGHAELARAWYLTGFASAMQGQKATARDAFSRALSIQPEMAWDTNFPTAPKALFEEQRATTGAQSRLSILPVTDGVIRVDGIPVEDFDEPLRLTPGPHLVQVGPQPVRSVRVHLEPERSHQLVLSPAVSSQALSWAASPERRADLSAVLAQVMAPGTQFYVVHDGVVTAGHIGGDWTTLGSSRKNSDRRGSRPSEGSESAAPILQVSILADLLGHTQWDPLPELSAVYRTGSIFEATSQGHLLISDNCVDASPRRSAYQSGELSASLQAGIGVRWSRTESGGSGGLDRLIRFGTPTHAAIPRLDLELSASCETKLSRLSPATLAGAYVIQEVLQAEPREVTCGRLGDGGEFTPMSVAESRAAGCGAHNTSAPVTVGYRTVPLLELMDSSAARTTPSSEQAGSPQGFDAASLISQLEAEQQQDERLSIARAACLDARAGKLTQQARQDWKQLSPLLSVDDAAIASRGVPLMQHYVATYAAAAVECSDEQGRYTQFVPIPEVDQARRWLSEHGHGLSVPGERWTGASGYAMRRIPAGTYALGCTPGQTDCFPAEKPAHEVTLGREILVGEREITQALWLKVMGSNPSTFSGCGLECPVETISWFDAARFANALSSHEGLTPCYRVTGKSVAWRKPASCSGYRLPTEAEWEVAARGGEDIAYSGGADPDAVAWHDGQSPRPVGQKHANAYGIHDMSGNVYEWVWDWFAGYPDGKTTDPHGPSVGIERVIRGGCWGGGTRLSRIATRSKVEPTYKNGDLGLRLVRNAD